MSAKRVMRALEWGATGAGAAAATMVCMHDLSQADAGALAIVAYVGGVVSGMFRMVRARGSEAP